MDTVFNEEQENLRKVEARIEKIASGYRKQAQDIYEREIKDAVCYDYDDRDRLRYYKEEYKKKQEYEEQYNSYKPCPYFGRMDMCADDENADVKSYYIGKEGILDNTNGIENLVIDWRSPVGEFFYIKTEKEFRHNEHVYQLLLRRALNIADARLINYNTEYDCDGGALEGEVIDPFLVTVLKDKRRQHKLTDIIRTIQGNQNEIIRKPKSESFIVQGCAGSGKTMILLHRLSYLLFNNRNLNLEGVKIITPNKFFNLHINDLTKELGLNQIERMTVEELYVYLIKSYYKKSEVESVVHSEKELGESALSELYSKSFYNEFVEQYRIYWESILNTVSIELLTSISQKTGAKVPDFSNYKSTLYTSLSQFVSSSLYFNDRCNIELSDVRQRYSKNNTELESVQSSISSLESRIVSEKLELSDLIQSERKKQNTTLSRLQEEKQKLINENAEEQIIRDEIDSIIANSKVLIQENIQLKQITQVDIKDFLEPKNDLNKLISTEIQDLIDHFKIIENEYRKIPIYNFGKRNKYRETLQNIEKDIIARVNAIIANWLLLNEKKQSQENVKLEAKKAELLLLNQQIEVINQELVKVETSICSLDDFESAIEKLDEKSLKVFLLDHEEYVGTISTYIADSQRFTEQKKKADNQHIAAESLLEKIKSLESQLLSENEKSGLLAARQQIDKLSLSNILRNVMQKSLREVYKKNEASYRKENYRHKLYLRLLTYSLYFEPLKAGMPQFLNIDEAQDISIPEYQLLKKILGNQSVFNLYGDVNQLVYSYKGIDDWESLSNIVTNNVYSLNENYRNTMQITKYCNDEFGAEVFPIGIAGDEVEDCSLENAICKIIEFKKNNPEGRAAIIYRHGIESIIEALQKQMRENDVSWDSIDDNKISIVTVEAAKGIEFEYVVAIISQMTANEKYIAFTRALDVLTVVRDEFLPNSGTIQADDDDSDELINETNTEYTDVKQGDISTNDNSQTKTSDETELNDLDIELFGEFTDWLDDNQIANIPSEIKKVFHFINQKSSIAYFAPSNNKKSALLYFYAQKMHKENGKQAILIADPILRENCLVQAENNGLTVGAIDLNLDEYQIDFKKSKYDVVFIPTDVFSICDRTRLFALFDDGISLIAVDHVTNDNLIDDVVNLCKEKNIVCYIMGRKPISNNSVAVVSSSEMFGGETKKYSFATQEDKMQWLDEIISSLNGQGIIYCSDKTTCISVARKLQKQKINAQAFHQDIRNEQQNYLVNAFTRGAVQILVSTNNYATYLSNRNLSFIIHFDFPTDRDEYYDHQLQITRVNQIYDLH